jgi:hypothetical protein
MISHFLFWMDEQQGAFAYQQQYMALALCIYGKRSSLYYALHCLPSMLEAVLLGCDGYNSRKGKLDKVPWLGAF